MKRYPRLSETFILNEICAMEALGERLEIFSLLAPEPPPHHPMVAQVQATVTYPPIALARKAAAFARAHAEVIAAAPAGYARALSLAARRALSSPSPLSSLRQFLRGGFFAAEARRRGVTHLHAHFANAPAAVAEYASRMLDIPFSFTAHAKDLYLTPAPLIAERTAAAAFVATCTHYNVGYFNDILPSEQRGKINLVYHGIDLSRFRYRAPSYGFQGAGAPASILSVGRLVPKKGFDDLIEACGRLKDMGVAFRCRIVGEGPLRPRLEAAIAARGLTELVTLEGAMTQDRLIGLFAVADLFALSPRITDDGDRDGIPNVIVEAVATGVPVVTTAISGIPELIEEGRTGLLVASNDPQGLALAMARLLSEAPLGRRMAAAGRARLEQCFDCGRNTGALRALMVRRVCEPVEAPGAVALAAE
ncbi:MAG: glycosyltransferase [Pseudomonadota bacterium]|nr:glycosyltransferase [Pseudomonadota bacterium]